MPVLRQRYRTCLTAINSRRVPIRQAECVATTRCTPMSRTLIIYYSRSGATRTLAAELAKRAGADMVALEDRQSRRGAIGFLRALWDASRGVLPPIEPLHVDLSSYDLVLLGTPVWAGRACTLMRRFLCDAAHLLPVTAYFCTYGGRGYQAAFSDMSDLDGKHPIATLAVKRRHLLEGHYANKLDRFLEKLAPITHRPVAEKRTKVPALSRGAS